MEPENVKNKHQLLNRLSTLLFYISLFVFIVALAFPHNPAGNWYQQFMPSLNGRQITDITFTDSLNGYAITTRLSATDTTFILRTTNKGDDWFFSYQDSGVLYTSLQFINQNTGFVAGYINKNNSFKLVKTTNSGSNWFYINAPFDVPVNDLFALDEDTLWLASSSAPTGGVFFTSNGGVNWQNQLSLESQNPDRIYMINGSSGFISKTNSYTRITTNSGQNWTILFTGSGQGFYDMDFVDNLTGWGTFFNTRKTTDGGLNWVAQIMPDGGNIVTPQIEKLSALNKDTIWGAGAQIFTTSGIRGTLNRTTNGGENWLFQVPDSTYNNNIYSHLDFYKLNGWAYLTVNRGIHTTTGGDPIWFTPATQISSEVPKEYKLFNNYPNPFNPVTNFGFLISDFGLVMLKIFDITGKEIVVIVNEKLSPGEYKADWNASGFSSGVYFYSLIIDGKIIDTRKMMLIK